MSTITAMMTGDHRACDALFVDVENHVTVGSWDRAATAMDRFRDATLRHLAAEEQELFPAIEAATGSNAGPTAVMRMEHEQIRTSIEQLGAVVEVRDAKRFLALSESLMVLVQQHNMKEEQILYPIADSTISDSTELVDRLRARQAS